MRNLRSIITNREMIRPLSRAPRSSVVIPASTTSHHAFVTIAICPSHRVRSRGGDLPVGLGENFGEQGPDAAIHVGITGEFFFGKQTGSIWTQPPGLA